MLLTLVSTALMKKYHSNTMPHKGNYDMFVSKRIILLRVNSKFNENWYTCIYLKSSLPTDYIIICVANILLIHSINGMYTTVHQNKLLIVSDVQYTLPYQ